MPVGGMPYRRAASTLLVAPKPAMYETRAMRNAASPPWVRRAAKSAMGRPWGRLDAAGRLGGQQRLVLDLVDDDGLRQLGRDDWPAHLQHRFVGEEETALWHGSHAAGETEIPQVFEEIIRENAGVAQVVHTRRIKGQRREAIQRVVNAGRHQVTPIRRVLANVKAECGFPFHPLGKVRLRHGQFV